MATYIRLTDYKSSEEKERGFFDPKNRYEAKQEDFEKIPGSPIAYWVSDKVKNLFLKNHLSDFITSREGMATADNDRFLRYWQEVDFQKIYFNQVPNKWYPYNKGGDFKKWYGNNEYLVNWENNGYEIKNNKDEKTGRIRSHNYNGEYALKEGITWSAISSSNISARYSPKGYLFDSKGAKAFSEQNLLYFLSLINTKIGIHFLKILSPTMDFKVGDIIQIPAILLNIKQIETLTQQNIDISKEEWDSRETSWDFKASPLLMENGELRIENGKIEDVYNRYCEYWREKFYKLHRNEEELNRLFIDIYELQDELTPDVELKDITILKNEAKIVDGGLEFRADEIIKQFISYGVGVMFGRYSLDHKGLHIANMGESLDEVNLKFNIQNSTFEADSDNIIPIVDESDYFGDDMTDRFIEFVRTTFGSEKLQQNITFIEKTIGKKLRAYFMKDFYADHVKRYRKRPIYWLFSSPKNTFQVLIYMHRYTPDTLNHILNDYLRAFRIRLDTMRQDAMRITESEEVSDREKTLADKKIDKIDATLDDINEYEKVLDHYAKQRIEIDLDDGVKVNYCKFKELLYTFDKKLCK